MRDNERWRIECMKLVSDVCYINYVVCMRMNVRFIVHSVCVSVCVCMRVCMCTCVCVSEG